MFTFFVKAYISSRLGFVSHITNLPVLLLFCCPLLIFFFISHLYTPKIKDYIMCESLSKIDSRIREVIEKKLGHESSGDIFSIFSECSQVYISDISMPQPKNTTNSIKEWLEGLLRSSGNIEILAERSLGAIGNGDKDLRMREMTSEEGASLKRYKEITESIMGLKTGLTVSYKISTSCLFFSHNFFFVHHSVLLLLKHVALFLYLPRFRPVHDRTRKRSHGTIELVWTEFFKI